MKGSGILNYREFTLETAIIYFLNNCKINMLSKNSLNGLILKLKLNNNVKSPFYDITLGENFNKPVLSIIIKCILINYNNQSIDLCENIIKSTMTEIDFDNEVNTQIDIYNRSITDDEFILEPICPAIISVYKNISPDLMQIIYNNFEGTESDKKLIYNLFHFQVKINLIIMEAIEGFNVLKENCDPKYEKFALFELMRLHKYGYIHGDYHKENILINTNYQYYFGNTHELMGKALILDFGRSKPINNINLIRLKSALTYEINSLSDNKTHWSYIWLSYHLYNCFDKLNEYLETLYKNRIKQNKIIIEDIIKQYPKLNTLDKIKDFIKIHPNIKSSSKSSSKNKSGGTRRNRQY